jgi:hypothetical protein
MCGFFQMRSFEAPRKARSAEFYAICDVADVLAKKMAAVHGQHDPAKALRWIQAQRPHGNPSETDTRIAAERRSGWNWAGPSAGLRLVLVFSKFA